MQVENVLLHSNDVEKDTVSRKSAFCNSASKRVRVMHKTYHMKWPDQLLQVKEKAQHKNVSQQSKKACKNKIMRNSQRKRAGGTRSPPTYKRFQPNVYWCSYKHRFSPMLAMILCTGSLEGASQRPPTGSPLLCFSSCLKMKAEFSSFVMLM